MRKNTGVIPKPFQTEIPLACVLIDGLQVELKKVIKDTLNDDQFNLDIFDKIHQTIEDSLRIWDFAKEQTFLNLDEYKQINTVAFSPDNNLIAFGTAKGKVIVWDLKQQHKIWQYDHEKSVNSVIFNPQNRNLVSGSEDGIIQIWEY